jgi:D-3-phosphoglycerate dehydrogenase
MALVFLTHDPDSLANFYGDQALAGLREIAEVRVNDTGRLLSTEELIAAAAGADIVVCDVNTPAEAVLFDGLPELAAFLRCAVDTRTIDIAAASRNGVLVTNASPGFVNSVAELIFGQMIDLARHVTASATAYHAGTVPPKRMGVQLAGTTIGILGYGSIGRFTAGLARAFGMTVLVCDPHKAVDEPGIEQVTAGDLLARSDFVVCLVVAAPETENLIDAAALAAMRPTAHLVNVARGRVVDEPALNRALQERRLAAAGLDVTVEEPLPRSSPLWSLPNVLITPHTAGETQAYEDGVIDILLENLERLRRGETLVNQVV